MEEVRIDAGRAGALAPWHRDREAAVSVRRTEGESRAASPPPTLPAANTCGGGSRKCFHASRSAIATLQPHGPFARAPTKVPLPCPPGGAAHTVRDEKVWRSERISGPWHPAIGGGQRVRLHPGNGPLDRFRHPQEVGSAGGHSTLTPLIGDAVRQLTVPTQLPVSSGWRSNCRRHRSCTHTRAIQTPTRYGPLSITFTVSQAADRHTTTCGSSAQAAHPYPATPGVA